MPAKRKARKQAAKALMPLMPLTTPDAAMLHLMCLKVSDEQWAKLGLSESEREWWREFSVRVTQAVSKIPLPDYLNINHKQESTNEGQEKSDSE